MIQVNELRIGSWVLNHYGNPEQIEVIEPKIVNGRELYSFHPIALTTSVLERCGFVSNPYQDRYELGKIHVELNRTLGYDELWIDGMPHIKYLHQLQNLFFALTGAEINYKPI